LTCTGECTPTVTDATDCAIVQSSIYLTAILGHEDEARADALKVIHHRLERGAYEEGTILHTSYLGPDLDKLSALGSNANSMNEVSGSSSSSSAPTTFYIAMGVVSLAIFSLVVFFVMAVRVRRERKKVIAVAASSSPTHCEIYTSTSSPQPSSSTASYFHSSRSNPSPEHYDRRSLLEQHDTSFRR